MVARQRNGLWLVSVLFFFVFLAGCAQSGLEYAPKGPYLGYHKELPAAACRRGGPGRRQGARVPGGVRRRREAEG